MRKQIIPDAPRPVEIYRLPNGIQVKGYYHVDITTPDGKRFESANPKEFAKVSAFVRDESLGNCEGCEPTHFIGKFGDPHHVRGTKAGGGFRDDRYIVGGIRQLKYVCRTWHDDEHAGRHAEAVAC